MKKLCPRKDNSLLGVPTQVGTFGKPEEICSGVWGYPYVGSSDKSQKFRLSGVPTQVGTSDIPNRKSCSDLTFWILIRTVLNSWETWKIRLREVSYWDKTTPLYIWEDHGRLSTHLSNRQTNQSTTSTPPLFTFFSNPHAVHPLIRRPRMTP